MSVCCRFPSVILSGLLILFAPALRAGETAPAPALTVKDFVYGQRDKDDLSLTLFKPAQPNGAAVMLIISGGWVSTRPMAANAFFKPMNEALLKSGYTTMAVFHVPQPKCKIPQIIEDVQRAVRFVHQHAAEFSIDPKKIGVMGGSAGGHLSLMLATTGADGRPDAADPLERHSSRVQCVVAIFPPTDFLNYGKPGEDGVGVGILKNFAGAFGVKEDTAEARKELGAKISPINFVSAGTPPALLVHGDADKLVPYQQAAIFIKKCEEAKVPCRLITAAGKGHGGGWHVLEIPRMQEWFDEHLLGKKAPSRGQ